MGCQGGGARGQQGCSLVRAVPLTASPMLLAYRATTVTWYSVSGQRSCSRMLVSPAGTLTCPGSEVTHFARPSPQSPPRPPLLTSLPPAARSAVAVPSLSGECTGPCSQSQGRWPPSTGLARTDCPAQTAPGLVAQRWSHRLGRGNQVAGSGVSSYYGEALGSRVRSAAGWAPPPGQDGRTAPPAGCLPGAQGRAGAPTAGGQDSRGSVTGTPPAVVHTLRETRGSSVLRMLKSLTKKKKSLVGCEATRFSSSGSAFLIPEVMSHQGSAARALSGGPPPQPPGAPAGHSPTANSLTPCPFSFWAAGSTRSWDFPSVMRMQTWAGAGLRSGLPQAVELGSPWEAWWGGGAPWGHQVGPAGAGTHGPPRGESRPPCACCPPCS